MIAQFGVGDDLCSHDGANLRRPLGGQPIRDFLRLQFRDPRFQGFILGFDVGEAVLEGFEFVVGDAGVEEGRGGGEEQGGG